MTYLVDGKQYIVVAISGGNYSASTSRSRCLGGERRGRSQGFGTLNVPLIIALPLAAYSSDSGCSTGPNE